MLNQAAMQVFFETVAAVKSTSTVSVRSSMLSRSEHDTPVGHTHIGALNEKRA
jgi:hypothetical protein